MSTATTTPPTPIQATLHAWAAAITALRSAHAACDALGSAACQVKSVPAGSALSTAEIDEAIDTCGHSTWFLGELVARLQTEAPGAVLDLLAGQEKPTPELWVDAARADMA